MFFDFTPSIAWDLTIPFRGVMQKTPYCWRIRPGRPSHEVFERASSGRKGLRPDSRGEGGLDVPDEGPDHLDAGPFLVVGLDEDPGSGDGAGLLDHVAGGGDVSVPAVAVPPVVLGQLVLLVGGRLSVAVAAELLVGGDRQPELQDDGPGVGQLLLEPVDLLVGPHPTSHLFEAI